MAYASVTQLKSWLDEDTGADDALLSDLIDRAQSWIETTTQRQFEVQSDTTRTFDAVDDVNEATQTLYLDGDLCQITSITNGDSTAVTAYVTMPRREKPYYAIRLKDSADPWTYATDPEDAISIVGRWGYSVTPPDVIIQATLRLAAWMYKQRDTGLDSDRPQVTAQGVMSFPAAMPKDVMQMLQPYRRVI